MLSYEQQAAEHYGKRYEQNPAVAVLTRLIAEGRKGKASGGGGFYDYQGQTATLWTGITELFPAKKKGFDRTHLEERLLFAQVLEAGWCLEEGILSLIAEANLGSIYGWGFPANFGGVVQYAKHYGAERFVARAAALRANNGPRYRVADALKEALGVAEVAAA